MAFVEMMRADGFTADVLDRTGWHVVHLERGQTRAGSWFHLLADQATA